MTNKTLKLELIEWLSRVQDRETLEYLKVIKDSRSDSSEWENELTTEQKEGIRRGLNDIEQGRTISHEEIEKKYGL